MSTPDVHADLVAKMVALTPASFPAAQTYTFAEMPPGGLVDEGSTSVKFLAERVEQYDKDGGVRIQTFQIKKRFDRQLDAKGTAAFAALVAFYDAIHGAGGIGAFTINAHDYIDLVASSFPRLREENYVIMEVALWFDQPST